MSEPTPLPLPIRAAAGLVARTLDDVRLLPTRLLSLPVLAAGTAMQVSLRLQQEYAALIARGDEVLLHLRGQDDDVPAWATFDAEDESPAPPSPGIVDPATVANGSLPQVEDFTLPPPTVPQPKPTKPTKKARARRAPLGAQPSAFDLVPDELGTDTEAGLAPADPPAVVPEAEAAGGSLFGEPPAAEVSALTGDPTD